MPEAPRYGWQVLGEVEVILPIGDVIYVGGDFTAVEDQNGNRITRNYLVAFDRVTGQPTDFNPNMSDKVFALAESPDGRTLYVGGAFRSVGSESRTRIAAFNLANGNLRDFKVPGPNSGVRALAVTNDTLYAGGLFQNVAGEPREHLAAFDIATRTLDEDWTPEASAGVKGLVADPDRIWVAGDFFRMNGETGHRGLSSVDPDDGSLMPVQPLEGYWAIDMVAIDNQILIAGGGPGGTAAVYDRRTGRQEYEIRSDGNFQGVAAFGDYVYFGGHHDSVFTPTDRLQVGQMNRFNRFTGEIDRDWLPDVNGFRGVNAVGADEHGVYIGGDFTFIEQRRQAGFAIFDRPSS